MKLVNCILGLLTLLSAHLFASEQIIDIEHSLDQAYNVRSSDVPQFLNLLEQIESHKHLLTINQIHHFNYLKAYSYTFSGDYDKAFPILQALTNNAHDKSLKIQSLVTLINVYALLQDWDNGLSTLQRTLNVVNDVESDELHIKVMLGAALLYSRIEQYDLALVYVNLAIENLSDSRELCIARQIALGAKYELNQLTLEDTSIYQSISICEQHNETVMLNLIRSYIANLYIEQGDAQEAVDLLIPHIQEIKESGTPILIAEISSTIAKAYWHLNDIKQAEYYASETIMLSDDQKADETVVSAYWLLYQIALKRNDYKGALYFHVKYSEKDKVFLIGLKAKHMAFQLAEHKTMEQQRAIERLNEQNNLLQLEKKLARTQAINNQLYIIILIILMVLLAVWGYRSRKVQKHLRILAEFDALTGVFNRRHFSVLANKQISVATKVKRPVSCIMFDLDKFKSINDNYGHANGDWVLKRAALACKELIRKDDIIGRLGGEEFAVILPGCSREQAANIAEQYRQALSRIDSQETGFSFPITASFGVTCTSVSGNNLDKLLADADAAMYDSKNNGRNQVTMFGAPPVQSTSVH